MSSSCSESVLTNILGGVLGVGTSPNSVGPVMNLKIGKNASLLSSSEWESWRKVEHLVHTTKRHC